VHRKVPPFGAGPRAVCAALLNQTIENQPQGYCNTEHPAGSLACKGPLEIVPVPLAQPGREVRLRLRSRAELLVSAVVGLRKLGSAGSSVRIRLGIVLNRNELDMKDEQEVEVAGGQQTPVPLQALVPVGRGAPTVGVFTGFAHYMGPENSGDLLVGPVSLIVTALPN
jgi:hypothetical protein